MAIIFNPDTNTFQQETDLSADDVTALIAQKQSKIDGMNNDIKAIQNDIAGVQAEIDALTVQVTAQATAIASGKVIIQPTPIQPAPNEEPLAP